MKPWALANELSYFVRDAFHYRESELLGRPVVVVILRAKAERLRGDDD